jgi:hypothetical protein
MRQAIATIFRHIVMFILANRGKDAPDADEIDGTEQETEVSDCIICGEEWEEGEIFCYHCGYQQSDDELPLHPPPVMTGSLTDPEGHINAPTAEELRGKLDAIAREKGIDLAFIVISEELKARVAPGTETAPECTLDGLTYALYNTWKVGADTGLKGVLVSIVPGESDRAMVQGRNGPGITGTALRDWYGGLNVPADSEYGNILKAEIEYIAGKISQL